MKTIFKYTFAAVAAFTSLTACQEFEDFDKTVDAAPGLVYVETGKDNLFNVNIVHRQSGSTGAFSTEFAIRSNTTQHGDVEATFVYDASLVESYNAAHKTSHITLPAEYLTLENATLTLPERAVISTDSIKISLTGDLTLLTERSYVAPLRIESSGIGASAIKGTVYIVVTTEVNRIRPITAIGEMIGFPAIGRSAWTADCGNFANLFDNDTSTSASFSSQNNTSVLNIDMKQAQKVTGLVLGTSTAPAIEYSVDGETFLQVGTPVSSESVTASSKMHIAFYDHIEARHLRLTFAKSSQSLSEVDIYKLDSDATAIYALTGTDNVITGKIMHKQSTSASTSDLNASFSAYATAASTSGYSVAIATDNSLVAAYNTAHKTTYEALPSEFVQITNASLSIAANATKSTTDATVSLKGDLSGLTNSEGYLTALKLTSPGAETSESRGVVYVVLKVENNKIRTITSINDLLGFTATGRSIWSADCADNANLFDNNTSTSVNFAKQNNNVVVIDLKSTRMVTGIHLNSDDFSSVSFEYSTDGQTFQTAGTPVSSEYVTSSSDRHIAFYDHLSARYLRLTVNFSSSRDKNINEFNIYQIESLDPTVYTECGTDNVLTGKVIHTPGGSFNEVSASFNVYNTVPSTSGYSVAVTADNSLVSAYNSAHGTSYLALPDGHLLFENNPCSIGANSKKSADQVKVSLTGNLTGLTNTNGYLVPLKLSASGSTTSTERGVVYIVITPAEEIFRKNFALSDIAGTPVADHSGWKIKGGDYHSGSWPEVIDGNTDTFMRPWGSPVNWTINLGKEYEMTGLVITARTDEGGSYQKYQPTAVLIEYSDDGIDFTKLGTPTSSDGNLVKAVPSSFVALYDSQKMRYIRITATYGSNMGIGEFNIYAK